MPKSNLKSLIGKLNETCRKALEQAAGLCLSQTHYEVEVEHLFIKLLDIPGTDLQKILRHFEINETRLVSDLTRAIEEFKTGNARNPALSPHIPRIIKNAWLIASVDFKVPRVRSSHILLAILTDDDMARDADASSSMFKKISVENLSQHLGELTSGSAEVRMPVCPQDLPQEEVKGLHRRTRALTSIPSTDRKRKG
jgi:type VI secretion system protein VasG